MLYVLTGSDVIKAKARAQELAGDSEVVRCGEGGEAFERAPSYISARALFSPKTTLILDRPLEDESGKLLLVEQIEYLIDTDTLVIAIQPDVPAPLLKSLRANKKIKLESFDLAEKIKGTLAG